MSQETFNRERAEALAQRAKEHRAEVERQAAVSAEFLENQAATRALFKIHTANARKSQIEQLVSGNVVARELFNERNEAVAKLDALTGLLAEVETLRAQVEAHESTEVAAVCRKARP